MVGLPGDNVGRDRSWSGYLTLHVIPGKRERCQHVHASAMNGCRPMSRLTTQYTNLQVSDGGPDPRVQNQESRSLARAQTNRTSPFKVRRESETRQGHVPDRHFRQPSSSRNGAAGLEGAPLWPRAEECGPWSRGRVQPGLSENGHRHPPSPENRENPRANGRRRASVEAHRTAGLTFLALSAPEHPRSL